MGSGTLAVHVAAVTSRGRAFIAEYLGTSQINLKLQPGNSWRVATTSFEFLTLGIDASGRFLSNLEAPFTISGNRPLLGVATVTASPEVWYVTTDGLGFFKPYYPSDSNSQLAFTNVHAVCAGHGFACFLTTTGRAACTDSSIFPPGGLEPLVEIACSEGFHGPTYACGLTASGDITCFGPGAPTPRTNSLKFKSLSIASPGSTASSIVVGITVGGELRSGDEFERVLGPPNATWQMLARNSYMFCSV